MLLGLIRPGDTTLGQSIRRQILATEINGVATFSRSLINMSRELLCFLRFTGALRCRTTFYNLRWGHRKGRQISEMLGDQLRSSNGMASSGIRRWNVLCILFHLSTTSSYKKKKTKKWRIEASPPNPITQPCNTDEYLLF